MPASTEFVRAGNWVFGTGLRAGDAPELFESMEAKLRAAGSSMSLVARLDQYYPDAGFVPPYHQARKQAFGAGRVPPSTSIIVSGLQTREARMDVQVMAATSASGYRPEPVQSGLNRPDASGYTPCVRVGDLIFVAGQLARDASGKLAVQGTGAETEYMVRHRLAPALDAAESGLDLVLKAQVYLSRPEDEAAFWRAWRQGFGERVPPTTVVPLRHPAFLTSEATIEINVIAAHRCARGRVRAIECDVEARMLDGLLFVAGLTGLRVLEQAKRTFAAAGTDLSNVVRALYFHSDIDELPDAGFPFAAVKAAGGPVLDLWGYAPNP